MNLLNLVLKCCYNYTDLCKNFAKQICIHGIVVLLLQLLKNLKINVVEDQVIHFILDKYISNVNKFVSVYFLAPRLLHIRQTIKLASKTFLKLSLCKLKSEVTS